MDLSHHMPKGVFTYQALTRQSGADFSIEQGPLGLGRSGVHELCEAEYGDFAALTGFAFAAARPARRGAILHVIEHRLRCEHGLIDASAAAHFRMGRRPVLNAMARKSLEALWMVEEAIASTALCCVIAEIADADFTATRRLSLAAARAGMPVILIMPYGRQGASAASARWRVSPRLSARNRHDPTGLGRPRWGARLERSRQAPHLNGRVFEVEYDEETLSLTMVSGMAADAPAQKAPESPRRRPPDWLRKTG